MMFQLTQLQHTASRNAITIAYRQDEAQIVADLFQQVKTTADEEHKIFQRALFLANHVRTQRLKKQGAEAFIREFSLAEQGHLALAMLVESLLRTPDTATRNKLVWDKLNAVQDWEKYSPQKRSALSYVGHLGLRLRQKNDDNAQNENATWVRVAEKSMEHAFKTLTEHYTQNTHLENALKKIKHRQKQGYGSTFALAVQPAQTQAEADAVFQNYYQAIRLIGENNPNATSVQQNPYLSLKLSALFPRFQNSQRNRVFKQLLPKLKELFLWAKSHQVAILIEAEEAVKTELSLDLFTALVADTELAGFHGLGLTVQAYQKRAMPMIHYLIEWADAHQQKIIVRLVKGNFWEEEIKASQERGLNGYPVFTQKAHIDLSYLACAKTLLSAPDVIYPHFATHNPQTVANIEIWGENQDFAFECMQGAGETLFEQLIGKYPCRMYSPVSEQAIDLMNYLVRRLAENASLQSIKHQLINEDLPLSQIVLSPKQHVLQTQGKPNPFTPLPRFLYGRQRLNPNGLDFSNELVLGRLQELMNEKGGGHFQASSIVGVQYRNEEQHLICNPADQNDILGKVTYLPMSVLYNVISTAKMMEKRWRSVPRDKLASNLMSIANTLEHHLPELLALVIRESGKNMEHAISELRLAIDFCRYYANEAETTCANRPPIGTVVCISPRNAPLSVFVGQIVAALSVGNVVLAKPAPQCCLTAYRTVELIHQAGIPKAALQLILGEQDVGAQLVADERINGVLFTGSIETAKKINEVLSQREDLPVLIAETGGQNAMIVDSTASTWEVCQDVVQSAFGNAGQNASAVRILCVQEEIADEMIDKLQGAMDELVIGNPMNLATDIGAMIDRDVYHHVLNHINEIKSDARFFHQVELPKDLAQQNAFIPPTLIELHSLEQIQHEIFGPVLHLLRYRAEDLGRMIDQINGKGYALAVGIHSRIDHTINYAANRIEAGNIYINRHLSSMTAGVQPFGGHNLSGTGPKAGASFYLQRLTLGKWNLPPLTRLGSYDKKNLEKLEQWIATQEFSRDAQVAFAIATSKVRNGTTLRLAQATLRGTVGEHNMMTWRAPKHIWLHGGSLEQALVALIPMVASGMQALVHKNHALAAFQTELEGIIRVSENPIQQPFISHVLSLEKPDIEMKTKLAQRNGSIVRVIDASDGQVDVLPLFEEVAYCNNKTAVGADFGLLLADFSDLDT